MGRISIIFLAAFFLFPPIPGLGQEAAGNDLDRLIAEAVKNNPELKAKREQAEAMKVRIKGSVALDAPQLGMEFYQTPIASFPNPLDDQMEIDYFIEQMFPLPGKLYAMKNSAKSSSEMADQEYRSAERELIMELKMAYYELYLIQRKIAINAENQKLVKSFVEIARKQYEVGMGNQADFLRAETELANLVKDGVKLEQDQAIAEAELKRILGRSNDLEFSAIPNIESEAPDITFERAKAIAKENNPELKMQEYNMAMSRAELAYSRSDYLPDLMVRGMYKDMQDTPDDFWALMIGVTLPAAPWSNPAYSSRLKGNELDLKRSEAQYQSAENMVNSDLKQALAKINGNKKLIAHYRSTLIPQAEQTLNSTISAYRTGKTEFLMVIDAYRMLQMAREDCEMVLMEYMSGQAELENVVGLSIEEIKQKLNLNKQET